MINFTTPRLTVLGPVGLIDPSTEASAATGTAPAATAIGGQQGALLALLAAAFPNPVRREAILEALWPNTASGLGRNSLGVALHRLRSRLPWADAILTEGDTYRLALEPLALDSATFLQALQDAAAQRRTGYPDAAAKTLQAALGLWRGHAFQPYGDAPHLTAATNSLHERRRDAEEDLVDALLACGQPKAAANRAADYVEAEPYRERRWVLLMTALYRAGQTAEALRAFNRARTLLADDLGLDPGPELQRTEAAILNHDRTLLEPSTPLNQTGTEQGPTVNLDHIVGPLRRRTAPIPASGSPFLGRASELKALADALDSNYWVTISGPPGIGKSRLAARHALGENDRRVIWLDTADLGVDEILRELAHQLDSGPTTLRSIDDLSELIQTQPTLIVIDNASEPAEAHDRQRLRALTEALLNLGGDLKLLATSRSPLGSASECTLPLGPLPLDDGAKLLVERAGAGTISLDAAKSVVDQVGGSPLQIKLLAGQLQVSSVDEVLIDLAQSLTPVGPSVESALDWSVDRLTPLERTLHDRLGVLAGWFSVADVAGVLSLPAPEVRVGLNALVSHGLLLSSRASGQAGVARYRQPLSVRTHARIRLEASGSTKTLEAARAEYFFAMALRLGEAIEGPDEAEAVLSLNQANANLEATFHWLRAQGDIERLSQFLLALSWYMFFRLEYDQMAWFESALALTGIETIAGYADLLAAASRSSWSREEYARSLELAAGARRVAAERGEATPLAAIRSELNIAAAEADMERAGQFVLELLAAGRAYGTERDQCDVLVNVAFAQAHHGAEHAVATAEQALGLAKQSRNPSTVAWAHCAMGFARLSNDPVAAGAAFAESLRLARTVHNRWVQAVANTGLATASRYSGRPAEAGGILSNLLEFWAATNNEGHIARALNESVLALHDLGSRDHARTVLGWTAAFSLTQPLLAADQQQLQAVALEYGGVPAAVDVDEPRALANHARAYLAEAGARTFDTLSASSRG